MLIITVLGALVFVTTDRQRSRLRPHVFAQSDCGEPSSVAGLSRLIDISA